jgi:hypothetical protein
MFVIPGEQAVIPASAVATASAEKKVRFIQISPAATVARRAEVGNPRARANAVPCGPNHRRDEHRWFPPVVVAAHDGGHDEPAEERCDVTERAPRAYR